MSNTVRLFYDEPMDKIVDAMRFIPWDETTICCIGTDRSTGDSLGPLIGTKLKQLGVTVPIVGDLAEPLHAQNLVGRLTREVKTPYTLGIDAVLGGFDSVGCVYFEHKPVRPGAGLNKKLPEVGDWSLTGVVNVAGFMEYFVLQNTRLHMVMAMADAMANALYSAIKTKQEAMLV